MRLCVLLGFFYGDGTALHQQIQISHRRHWHKLVFRYKCQLDADKKVRQHTLIDRRRGSLYFHVCENRFETYMQVLERLLLRSEGSVAMPGPKLAGTEMLCLQVGAARRK